MAHYTKLKKLPSDVIELSEGFYRNRRFLYERYEDCNGEIAYCRHKLFVSFPLL